MVAAAGILYWLFAFGAARDIGRWPFRWRRSWAVIFGNLYDRLGLPALQWNYPEHRIGEPVYAVRDWLHFRIEGADGHEVFDWPVFNIADCLLVSGSVLLALYGLKHPTAVAANQPATT